MAQGQAVLQAASATISNTAIPITTFATSAFSAATLARATRAIISPSTDAVKVTVDGTTPTATLGMTVTADQNLTIEGNQAVGNIKLIRRTNDAPTLITLFSD